MGFNRGMTDADMIELAETLELEDRMADPDDHRPTAHACAGRPDAVGDAVMEPIDSGTLWELHLAVARNDRARGDVVAAERSMRSARAHAVARKLAKKLAQ
jgi:hypothetical protein